MANIILPAVPVLNEIDDSTKLLIEQAGEINRYPISDLDIGGGDITIEIDPSAKEKPQSPLYSTSNDTHFYPLTTADQVILDDGNRLDDEISKYLTVELEGEAAEPNSINADTLGGYAADEYVRKDQYGIELNYSVVGSMEEPTNPTQNMIWIQTETPIGRVFFGNDEPNETFMEGDVWIITGSDSNVAFNSLKIGNSYMDMVYPLNANQYVSGAWVDKTAKTYQNGEWVTWVRYLYNAGNEYEEITGGWTSSGYSVSGYTTSGAEKKADCISFAKGSNSMVAQIIGTVNKVNMDDIKNIRVTYKNTLISNGFGLELKIQDGKDGNSTSKLSKQFTAAVGVVTTEDIPISSGLGDCYIIFMTNKARNAELYSVEYT